MKIKTTAKRIVGTIALCCSLVLSNPAKAFVWPCIDITQIGSFASSIKTGLSTVTNAKGQLDNMMNTVKAIGDQASAMKKYVADLRDTITKLKETVDKAVSSVTEAIDNTKKVIDDIKDKADEILNKEKQNADSTVDSINQGAESGYSSSDLQDIINAARQQSEKNREAINALYDEALDHMNETLDNANTAIDEIVEAVNTNQELSQEDKEKLKTSAEEIKNDISKIKENANKTINEAKENLNSQYANEISSAYDAYSKAIDDYALGKITIDELKEAGETFKETVNSLDSGLTQSIIDDFSKQVDDVVQKIENLKEEMLNTVSNSGEYSDEDEATEGKAEKEAEKEAEKNDDSNANGKFKPLEQKTLKPLVKDKFSFSFLSQKNNVLSVALYNEDVDGSPFLISKELMCNDKDESDLEKLSNPSWLRTCIARAKMNEEIYPDALEDELYKPYLKNGVYKHILQDYSAANIVTISRAKQFASSFRGDGSEAKSEYESLEDMISEGHVDNTLQGLSTLSIIELWTPRIWSMVRQVDAVHRAKEMVKIFLPEKNTYIDVKDGENEDVATAISENRGVIDNQKVFPNVILQHCHMDNAVREIKAENISVKVGEELADQEENLKKCLFMYASGVSRGYGYTKDEKDPDTSDAAKKEWRDKQKKALNDAAFENLVLAIIANNNSTKDYIRASQLPSGAVNIVSLQDGIKQISQARDGYSAGAEITYYGTQQMLNMIDSDALNIQTEILKDLQTFDFNYFPDEE